MSDDVPELFILRGLKSVFL